MTSYMPIVLFRFFCEFWALNKLKEETEIG